MADAAQLRRDPLAGIATPGRHGRADGAPGVVATLRNDVVITEIAAFPGRTGAVMDLLADVLDIRPTEGPRAVGDDARRIIGKGPGRWLVVIQRGSAESMPDLRRALVGLAAVADQGDARLVLRLTGPRLRDTLAKGVPVDLDPTAFDPGSVASTLVAYVPMTLISIDTTPTFDLLAPRSLAGSAWHWLAASAAPYGCELRTNST